MHGLHRARRPLPHRKDMLASRRDGRLTTEASGSPRTGSASDLVRAAERRPRPSLDFLSLDEAAHALACHLLDPRPTAFLRRRPAPPPQRRDDGSPARAGRRVRTSRAGIIGGVRDAETRRQGQRAGLVEHARGRRSASRSMRVAGIEQHAGPEHGARGHGLHSPVSRSPSAQGQVMIRTAIGGDDGLVPVRRPQAAQPSMVSSASVCTDGGIEPRGAVGELRT